jgi:hypothetical protein
MVAIAMAITRKDIMKDIAMKDIDRDLDGCVLTVGPGLLMEGDLSDRFLGSGGELSCDTGDFG